MSSGGDQTRGERVGDSGGLLRAIASRIICLRAMPKNAPPYLP
jgi:hypothetical protein